MAFAAAAAFSRATLARRGLKAYCNVLVSIARALAGLWTASAQERMDKVRSRARSGERTKGRSSLREIAGITGFSMTTVSMVLNGRAEEFNISRHTRDLILAAAREHNYQPNLHARSLRSRTTDILGLMVPTLTNPFFSEMSETFERLARSDRKLALITVTHYDPQEEIDAINYFASQKVECVFTANLMALEEASDLCSRNGTKQILLDSQESSKHTVSTDNLDAGRALGRRLLSSMAAAGRSGRVYYVGGMATHRITQHRLAGFRQALAEQGFGFSADQFVETEFDADSAYRRIKALFRSRRDIGGLFLNAVPPLEGLVRFFPEAPGRCREIHYGVFDYHPIMSLLVDLRLLIVKQNPDRMMQKAYQIFSSGQDAGRSTIHFIPYDIILTPAMKACLGDRG
jgi:DNA-binding LacI/PurR family transcriptional regulator